MNEFIQHIAEVEGVRTPKRKRSKKEIEASFEDFKVKRAKTKTAKAKKTAAEPKTPKPAAAKNIDKKSAPAYAEPIPLNYISPDGYVREAGYNPKTKLFYIQFAKSTWAMPSNAGEWTAFEKAVADPLINIDSYYRTAFRGRTGSMLAVRKAAAK